MKKPILLLLLMILAYLQMGYYWHSLQLRMTARQEFKAAVFSSLPDSSFDLLVYQEIEKDVEWEEEGKEFWFKGELYDVVRLKSENNLTYIYCVNDTKEEEIVKQQLKLTGNNLNLPGKQGKSSRYTGPDYIFSPDEAVTLPAIFIEKKFFYLTAKALPGEHEPISPPPQV